MNLKDLEKKCINESIQRISVAEDFKKSFEVTDNASEYDQATFCNGQAHAFMVVAAWIQNMERNDIPHCHIPGYEYSECHDPERWCDTCDIYEERWLKKFKKAAEDKCEVYSGKEGCQIPEMYGKKCLHPDARNCDWCERMDELDLIRESIKTAREALHKEIDKFKVSEDFWQEGDDGKI